MHSFVSARLVLFLASLIIFGVGFLLIRKNSHSRKGGDDYVRRKKLKTLGWMLLFPALLLFGLAALNDEMATESDIPPIDPEAAAAAQAYVPPVLSRPTESLLSPKDTWKTRMPGTNAGAYSSVPSRVVSTPSAAAPFTLPSATPSAMPSAPFSMPSTPPPSSPPSPSHPLSKAEKIQADLDAAAARIAMNPKDADAYNMRANTYALKRDWDAAARDYQSALEIDSTNNKVKFNLAEMSFMKKNFDVAKTGFVTLEQDPDLGDLAAYKVFLCDLFSGQNDAAAKELDAFNQVAANASYYFANAAWSINHRKPDDARDWLRSATRIYSPEKFKLYATTLFEMGYLPLPTTPAN